MEKVGTIKEIWLYPVKSMRGMAVESAEMYWYGLRGDRRYAFVQANDHTTFPWLTGREVPSIVQYQPKFADDADRFQSEIEVQTPKGGTYPINGSILRQELAEKHEAPVHLMQLNRGAFDAASMSIISQATLDHVSTIHGANLDLRRFRINLIIESEDKVAYVEDRWIDKKLAFGKVPDATAILPVRPIKRCVMVNIDPESAERDAAVLKNVVKSRDNCLGVYAWPGRVGQIQVGDPVFLTHS